MKQLLTEVDTWIRRKILGNLLETVEEGSDKVCGAQETGPRRQGGLGVGQYPQIVLAYGKQLDTLDLADKWLTPRIGMDVPGGRLQVGSSLRLLITAHCGSARWVVWGLGVKYPWLPDYA